jgi:Flp pilus assembly protein TadG
MRYPRKDRRSNQRGSTLVEFSFIALVFFMILFTTFEMDRMVLVMTALADSTRAGVRYAAVHGSDNPATSTEVTTVIKNFAASGSMSISNVNVSTLTYTPDMNPGSTVDITVTYLYNPLTRYFPLQVTLSSTSQGVITY